MPTKVRLGDVTSHISSGSTPRGGQSVYLNEGPVMLVRSQNVRMNRLDLSDVAFITDAINSEMKRSVVQPNDVLLNITGASIGRVARFPFRDVRANVNQHVCIVRPVTDHLDSRFLTYYLSSPQVQHDINNRHQHGGTRQALTFAQIGEFEIPLPPLSEQKRIADILDKADTLRRKRQEAEARTDTVAEAAFFDLFGHPLVSPRWPMKSIGEVGTVKTGNTPSTKHPEYFGGNVPWVRPSELGDWLPVSRTEKTLSETGLLVARSIRPGGTMVCCIGATLGKVGIVTQESAFNQQINAVDFGSEIDDWYGMFCMRLMADRFISEATHTTLPILNKGDFSKQTMPVPPINLQNQFGSFISQLLETREVFTAAQKQTCDLFNSLVQRAFRGEL